MSLKSPVKSHRVWARSLPALGLAGMTWLLAGGPARAQEPPAPAATDAAEAEAPVDENEPVEDRLFALEQKLAQMKELNKAQQPSLRLSAYIDFGFFVPEGNGTGYVQDLGPAGSRHFPEYTDKYAWVFLGDLLAPTVNSRGEAADLGNAPGVKRFDSVASRGAPGFLVNEVNVNLAGTLAPNALATASVNFAPRSGSDFALGDSFDVDLAQVEWMPTESRRTSLFAGKIESVLGIEYRDRKANHRFGVTPSLIARYTIEPALGLKVRSKFGADDWLVLAAAVTNGSNGYEAFHFHDEVDSNFGKTASGRVSVAPPLLGGLEIGVSGAYGAQDRALDSAHALWFAGVDARLSLGRADLKAQWLVGRGEGEGDTVYEGPHRPYGLRLRNGGYLEGDIMLTPAFGLLVRGELRDALVWLGDADAPGGAERLYVTKSWRATGGLRYAINQHVVAKVEYLHNGEYGGVPSIRNDVFTSSLILAY